MREGVAVVVGGSLGGELLARAAGSPRLMSALCAVLVYVLLWCGKRAVWELRFRGVPPKGPQVSDVGPPVPALGESGELERLRARVAQLEAATPPKDGPDVRVQ